MFKGRAKDGTKSAGDAGEARALDHLQRQGLSLVCRNYRVARGPGAHAGEIDLILREPDGTLIFVEVRTRGSATHGGAAGSVTSSKQRRIVYAARHYLMRLADVPPCRFDVVAIEGEHLQWIHGAFEA